MNVKLILPALAQARAPGLRGAKYQRFPPLGLATLAAYLSPDDHIDLQDEHVETLNLDDDPNLVVIQTYTSSAYRAYHLADHYRRKGAYVCIGGLHVTSMPLEAARHADSIFLGPGEDTWPRFLRDFHARRPRRFYRSTTRSLLATPPPRRDLIKSHLYLVPNTLVVSRGCPHHCDFCYKDAFFRGGRGFYTMAVDEALAEIDRLAGRHLCFLDDNLLGDPAFAETLFDALAGSGRVWLAAGTVQAVLTQPRLIEKAVAAGMRSLFIGFETLSSDNLRSVGKVQNLNRDYGQVVRRLHSMGVMVNGSFVFGMDGDDESIFERTAEWAVTQGIESATFHILTPYPGTVLHRRLAAQGRILTSNWDLYDARHAVFQPAGMSSEALEAGFQYANRHFGSWPSIWRAAATKETAADRLRHLLFSSGLRKWNPLWSWISRHGRLPQLIPLMESILAGLGRYPASRSLKPPKTDDPPTLEVDAMAARYLSNVVSAHTAMKGT